MTDLVGPTAGSGESSQPRSSPSRSPADAAVTIAGIAAIVVLTWHGLPVRDAAMAIAALLVPETSPLGPARRLLGKLLPVKE